MAEEPMLVLLFSPVPERTGLQHVYRNACICCERCGWKTRTVMTPKKGWGASRTYVNPHYYVSLIRTAERHRCETKPRKKK